MFKKAEREQLQLVLVTAMMRECEVETARHWLDSLPNRHIEIVCNDWGMLELVKQAGFVPVLGTLLNKRRKDARLAYKTGMAAHQAQLRETAVHAAFYREWLEQTYGVKTVSFETCGYIPKLTPDADVYAPFFQMNTAGHCTLYAACHNGSRGRQTEEIDCPRYCHRLPVLPSPHPGKGKLLGDIKFVFPGKGQDACIEGSVYGVGQRQADFLRSVSAEPKPEAEAARYIVLFQLGLKPHILHVAGGTCIEVDTAENTAEAEKVLVFQPGAGAALVNFRAQPVSCGLDIRGQVEFRGGKAIHTVAHKVSVEP